jgi:hypothetical protein
MGEPRLAVEAPCFGSRLLGSRLLQKHGTRGGYGEDSKSAEDKGVGVLAHLKACGPSRPHSH